MRDWWEENIHYYDYDPDALGGWTAVDTFKVAEAVIYSADDTAKIGLVFLVTQQDLMVSGITKEAVVAEARRLRPNIVQEWRVRAEDLEESIQVLFDWRGQEIERRPVKR